MFRVLNGQAAEPTTGVGLFINAMFEFPEAVMPQPQTVESDRDSSILVKVPRLHFIRMESLRVDLSCERTDWHYTFLKIAISSSGERRISILDVEGEAH